MDDVYEKLLSDYATTRPQYEAFSDVLDDLFKRILKSSDIEYFAIEKRCKTLGSFDGKIQREDKQGKYSRYDDVTDLSGIRLIAYLQEDCDKICEIIESEFLIDKENSTRKVEDLDPDKFGYLSTHYVISLNKERSALREFSAFSGMKAEVQVRTLLQHTWAAIDWKFRYKEDKEAPKVLRRRLFRISALLEAADNEFSSVKSQIDELRKSYSESIERGDLDIPLNTESVFSYCSESKIVSTIVGNASASGIEVIKRTDPKSGYDWLVKTANILGFKKISDLDNSLSSLEPKSEEFYNFVSSFVSEKFPSINKRLIPSAMLRYLLLADSSAAKMKEVNSEYSVVKGFYEAIVAYKKDFS